MTKSISPQLKKHVAEADFTGFELANLDQKIGPRLTHDQIEQTMRESKSVEMMKANRHLGRLGQRQTRKTKD